LARRAPTIKFATAGARGHHVPKYLPAMACRAGLWWAKQQKMKVYYCLDGLKDQTIIDHKSTKTAAINRYHSDPEARQYVEVTTLAEIHEILTNWTEFEDTVTFSRKGQFLSREYVQGLIESVKAKDLAVAGTRQALRSKEFLRTVWDSGEVPAAKDLDLDDPALQGMSGEQFYAAVSQLLLLHTAFAAESDQVLAAYLTSKGASKLVANGMLPAGFGDAYKAMIKESDPTLKGGRAGELLETLKTGTMPATFKGFLADAITRFSRT
jgi:hypothetical protein